MNAPPPWLQLKRANATAEEVLEFFQIRTPPVDVEMLASSMGVIVEPADMGTVSGAVVSSSEEARIYISTVERHWRRRFIVAHELGHLMLHALGQKFRDTNFTGDWQETQANQFAAELLMPISMLGTAFASTGGSIERLARLFAVSEAAMSVRVGTVIGR